MARRVLGDLLLVAAAEYALLVGTIEAAVEQVPPRTPLDAVAFSLLGVSGISFPLHHRAPLVLLGLQSLLVGVYFSYGYPYGPLLVAVSVAAYVAAVRHERAAVAAVVGVAACAVVVAALLDGGPRGLVGWAEALFQAAWILLPAVVGGTMRMSRASAARADQEAQRCRVEEERLRLAREVHDVVGHSLSVISLQAGVALHVLSRRPEQAKPALEAIRRTSAEALAELRTTLALTRSDADEADRVPVAGLSRLDALVAGVRRCGLPVTLEQAGAAQHHLPSNVDLTAFRVVQESLTNVLRHAGSAHATVRVLREPEHLRIVVEDDGAGSTAPDSDDGHGLAGLRERVHALGGHLEAGPRRGQGWRVEATMPLPMTGAANPAERDDRVAT